MWQLLIVRLVWFSSDHKCTRFTITYGLHAVQVGSISVVRFLFKGAGIPTKSFLICPETEAAVSLKVVMCFNQANRCLFCDCIFRSTFGSFSYAFNRMGEWRLPVCWCLGYQGQHSISLLLESWIVWKRGKDNSNKAEEKSENGPKISFVCLCWCSWFWGFLCKHYTTFLISSLKQCYHATMYGWSFYEFTTTYCTMYSLLLEEMKNL